MNRALLFRAIVALVIVAGSAVVVLTTPVNLGLDLRGGTQIVLETQDSPTVEANSESTDRAVEVLRKRVDALGVSEPSLTRSGDRRIIVELPGVQDPREAAEVIGRTAQLTFHPVEGVEPPDAETNTVNTAGDDPIIIADEEGEILRLGPAALTGEGVGTASAEIDLQSGGGWFVTVDFKGAGQDDWLELTGDAACNPAGDPKRRIAIVLDDQVISSPQVDPGVQCDVGITGGSTQITGNFTDEEAKELGVLIRGGALPIPVEVIEQRTVGATLGEAAIDASAKAAVIGIILTGLFIVVVYRLVGFLATIALGCYALISYAALLLVGATLTLPGLAGFVLAIGIAIDANVLVFERAKEEYAATPAKGLRTAITTGFAKAWTAIIDSNVTTLLAAGLLFYFASGPVKGFGVTLAIGVLASMVSALLITRVLVEFALSRGVVKKRPAVTGVTTLGRVRTWLTDKNPNLMKRGRLWLSISAILLILSFAGMFIRGLDYGVEFTGGRLVEFSTSQPVSIDDARAAVSDAGFPRAVVQESGDSDITVRTSELTNDEAVEIQEAIGEASGGEATKLRDELIGPSLGDELRRNALIALGIALLAQLAYLAFRFRWTFGLSTVAGMAHDVIILVGIFAWLGRPIDGVFLAALLTVIGYSVNDSVVVFDRIREMWGEHPKSKYASVVNTAILQTVPRTVNTGIGALFILGALFFLGGDSLEDFALALIIGIVVGTFSSMFTAAPLSIELERINKAPPPQPKVVLEPGKTKPPRAGTGAVV